MLAEYVGLLLIFAVGLVLVVALLAVHLTALTAQRPPPQVSPPAHELRPLAPHHRRDAVKFYVIAMLFVVFDAFAVFFYPWGAVFRELGWHGYAAMSIFALPLLVGLFYEWQKGAYQW